MEIWQWAVVVAGGIASIGAAIATIKKWLDPLLKLSKRMDEVELHDKRDIQRFDAIDKKLSSVDNTNQAVLIALHAILSHLVTDNSTGEMDRALKELVKHIVKD